MKLRTIFCGLTSGLLLGISSCSLDYEPLDTYSDVTEGITDNGTKIVFKDKAAVESHLTTLTIRCVIVRNIGMWICC